MRWLRELGFGRLVCLLGAVEQKLALLIDGTDTAVQKLVLLTPPQATSKVKLSCVTHYNFGNFDIQYNPPGDMGSVGTVIGIFDNDWLACVLFQTDYVFNETQTIYMYRYVLCSNNIRLNKQTTKNMALIKYNF